MFSVTSQIILKICKNKDQIMQLSKVCDKPWKSAATTVTKHRLGDACSYSGSLAARGCSQPLHLSWARRWDCPLKPNRLVLLSCELAL